MRITENFDQLAPMLNPGLLIPGNLVLVVNPSYSPDSRELEAGIESFKRIGFRVETQPSVSKPWGQFAGTDQERLEELQWALDHPEAKLIICSRGGYGMGRIIRELDFTAFAKNPKWLIGFSDITLLHMRLQELGFASIHGPMMVHHSRLAQLPACLKQQDFLIRKSGLNYQIINPFPETQKNGISGILVGGNLSLLCYQILESEPEFFENRIVFIEETGESYHKIDRMMDMLVRTGKLEKAAGFVLGTFDECPENGFPMSPAQMLREKIQPEQPIFSGLHCGHESPSFPLILGYEAEISEKGSGWMLTQTSLPLIS